MDEVNKSSLVLFNAVIEQEGPPDIKNLQLDGDEKLEKLLQQYSVVVLPKARYAIELIKVYIETTRITVKQLNSTFYSCWEEVMKLTPFDILMDRLLHYLTFWVIPGEVFIPSTLLQVESEEKLPIFVVGVLQKQQACDKAVGLLKSGTALKQETITHVLTLLRGLDYKLASLEGIRNKEARVVLMKEFQLYDVTPEEFLRFLIYEATAGITLLIKSKSLIARISKTHISIVPYVKKYPHVESLATIFNRYKPLFLALKLADTSNVSVINRISKLSKKKHVPLAMNPLNYVTSRLLQESEHHWLKNATTAVLLRVLNSCKLASVAQTGFVYHIRNGKSWISDRKRPASNTEIAKKNFDILSSYISQKIGKAFKGKKVYIPPHIEYGLPTSEKQLIGNIPIGTKISTSGENLLVGISWKPEYNVSILDLSAMLLDGTKLGWNSIVTGIGVIHSGDIVSFRDGVATEYLFTPYDFNADLSYKVVANAWKGDEHHSYDIIVAKGDKVSRGSMVNPENVIFTTKFNATQLQTSVGAVLKRSDKITFVLYPLDEYNRRTSVPGPLTKWSTMKLMHDAEHSISLNEVLVSILGCEMVGSPDLADIDLSVDKMSKDFFNLLVCEH